jgi:hypothetical protein
MHHRWQGRSSQVVAGPGTHFSLLHLWQQVEEPPFRSVNVCACEDAELQYPAHLNGARDDDDLHATYLRLCVK